MQCKPSKINYIVNRTALALFLDSSPIRISFIEPPHSCASLIVQAFVHFSDYFVHRPAGSVALATHLSTLFGGSAVGLGCASAA